MHRYRIQNGQEKRRTGIKSANQIRPATSVSVTDVGDKIV